MLKSKEEITATSICNECGAYYLGLAGLTETCPNCGAVGQWILDMFPGSRHQTALQSYKCFYAVTKNAGAVGPEFFDNLKVLVAGVDYVLANGKGGSSVIAKLLHRD